MLGTTNASGLQTNISNLSISINGTNVLTYDGTTTKTLDITLSSLGAAASNHNHDTIYSKISHTHDYLPLSGGTVTGNIGFSPKNTEGFTGITGQVADNDYWRIGGSGIDNNGCLEIAVGDDGTEPIYVRQYTGTPFAGVLRSATLLDANGNTSFPGSISEAGTLLSNKYAPINHSHGYLPLSGGTMNGPITLKNGTWNAAGDDAWFGDHNLTGSFCIKGANGPTSLVFVKREDNTYQKLYSDATVLTVEKNMNVQDNLYEGGHRVTTRAIVSSGNITTFDRFFTIYNHGVDESSGVTGLEAYGQYGLCMTVKDIGTPFQIWFPDSKMIIAKRTSGTYFNVLQFCRMASTAPNTDLLWCW